MACQTSTAVEARERGAGCIGRLSVLLLIVDDRTPCIGVCDRCCGCVHFCCSRDIAPERNAKEMQHTADESTCKSERALWCICSAGRAVVDCSTHLSRRTHICSAAQRSDLLL